MRVINIGEKGMFGIIGFLEGRAEIFADNENRERLISFFIENDIRAKVRYCEENGGVYTEMSPLLLKKIAPALDKLNIMVYIINIYGFKRMLSRYRERLGLLVGGLLFCALFKSWEKSIHSLEVAFKLCFVLDLVCTNSKIFLNCQSGKNKSSFRRLHDSKLSYFMSRLSTDALAVKDYTTFAGLKKSGNNLKS